MLSPERGGGRSEHGSRSEQYPPIYYRAAQCTDGVHAAQLYAALHEVIAAEPCDLSVFRFARQQVPQVAVVGTPPPPHLDGRLTDLVAAGEPIALPPALLAFLAQRRAQAGRLAPWVEYHTHRSPQAPPTP